MSVVCNQGIKLLPQQAQSCLAEVALAQKGRDALSVMVVGDARGASYEGRSMTHPVEQRSVERRFLARANAALMLGLVCGGLALCAFGAVAFDVSRWLVD